MIAFAGRVGRSEGRASKGMKDGTSTAGREKQVGTGVGTQNPAFWLCYRPLVAPRPALMHAKDDPPLLIPSEAKAVARKVSPEP